MSQLNASLLRLKLLDALRSGNNDKVGAIIQELSSTASTTHTTDIALLKQTILHYAVQVAPMSTLEYLIKNSREFDLNINSQDRDGNTPLHLAALSSRMEVVKYLLSLPDINDTIVNLKKKQPVELCKDMTIIQLMQFERAKFVETAACKLRQYFSDRDFENLEALLVHNSRASELLDINGADPDTGNTVLHEFIKKDDIQMCDWILRHGGDPFKRDKRGKLPIDLINGKNDPLKKLIKSASKDENIMDPVINTNNAIKSGGAPTYKGYLRKWTNFASGYKLRYFVLDQNGILSYYANQDDTNNSCRGSLNLGFATLHLDSSEKLKFEIIGKNDIRWHLKANHPIETNRWVWTLQNAITIAKDNLKKRNPEKQHQSPEEFHEKKSRHKLHIPGRTKHKRAGSLVSVNSASSFEDEGPVSRASTFSTISGGTVGDSDTKPAAGSVSPNLTQIKENKIPSRFSEDRPNFDVPDYDLDDIDGAYDSENDSLDQRGDLASNDLSNSQLGDQISSTRRLLDIEMSSLLDVFKNSLATDTQDLDISSVGANTLALIQELFLKYDSLINSRDKFVSRKLERQLEVNRLWENSIRQLENEIAQREEKLLEFEDKKKQLRKYFSSGATVRTPGSSTPNVVEQGAKSDLGPAGIIGLHNQSVSVDAPKGTENQSVPEGNDYFENHDEIDNGRVVQDILHDDSEDEFFDADEFEESNEDLETETALSTDNDTRPSTNKAAIAGGVAGGVAGGAAIASGHNDDESTYSTATKVDDDSRVEKSKDNISKEDDLNAVEAEVYTKSQKYKLDKINEEGSFLGYENPPRDRLGLSEDNRPQIGLWGILKSMIGKDMTKMTLPVSFNECTSLLQRLAEDIEYSTLLDKAAQIDDSTLRMVYVAAFAASEYASTINRIAKPFNPLLGETFEYCRPDHKYRLIVEQVSHHPPISACSAESVNWDYYGENAVASAFKGRSFDFKHLGKMFCVIRPNNGVKDKEGKVVDEELYSWKKVNTSVVGIMVGNPTVDNFGKMEVTNHTTGDKIIVDMKQRGWRASSAYQLSGHVVDKSGKTHWAIGGHWNSKIFGKKVIGNPEEENKRRNSLVDSESVGNSKTSNDPESGNKFLVWQAAPRPKVPFNLTSFAITLNGIDNNLKRYLPPTDTRLRPDQRAMEDGKYDLASDEKVRVEEKQRGARKNRELAKKSYKPNWFVKSKHPVTGDDYWEFQDEYWKLRRDGKLEHCGDIF
ncbi:uncharacterized protein AC631_02318 [Debaryomyces fabryi]|uniref:PH domain-containing protein n=1 Tax=Debaryomyces fabryi TaxID=58627 RepID=A0A0V1Q0Q0_9ASCO|nr:uncharacterized protein AC631_02318 [Debaryomyces fabryi]KSA01946.1 hypothetical protein AC631_02318 [Debaryomyces fabryi]CUM48490.1 unnamed protein product [Debaryomyces fabryi]